MDPYLFMKKNTKGLVFIGLYVDDNLFIGHPTAINDLIGKLRNHGLILKVEDNLKDYLSCKINFSCNMKQSWLDQLHLISNLEKHFGDRVSKLRVYKTHGTPILSTIWEGQALMYKRDVLLNWLKYLKKFKREKSKFEEPKSCQDTSKCKDGFQKKKSCKAIMKGLKDILWKKSREILSQIIEGVSRGNGFGTIK
jgi:hypothetical protein